MFTAEEGQFLSAHRWAVLSHLDSAGRPASSVVGYARDGDRFVVSTPGATAKRHRIAADGRVNLCVLSNCEPFNFVAVSGRAIVTREALERRTRLVFAAIADAGWKTPEDLPAWLEQQDRVILLVEPERHHTVMR